MATNYTADPTASQAPSPAPSLAAGVLPILSVPADGDNLNASSVAQAFKTLADWTGFLKETIAPYRGTQLWSSTVTYSAGMTVLNPVDSRVYRSMIDGNINITPIGHNGAWAQCDYSSSEIEGISGALTNETVYPLVSNGGSCTKALQLAFANGGFSLIFMVLQNVPYANSVNVDMSSADCKFTSVCNGGFTSMMSDGFTHGGICGYNPVTSPNVFSIWASQVTTGAAHTCNVGVLLWGM